MWHSRYCRSFQCFRNTIFGFVVIWFVGCTFNDHQCALTKKLTLLKQWSTIWRVNSTNDCISASVIDDFIFTWQWRIHHIKFNDWMCAHSLHFTVSRWNGALILAIGANLPRLILKVFPYWLWHLLVHAGYIKLPNQVFPGKAHHSN